MRRKHWEEKPYRGFARLKHPIFEVAVVRGVDTKNRTCDIDWINKSGGQQNIPIWNDTGGYGLPDTGDFVATLVDPHDRVHIFGFRDQDHAAKIDNEGLFELAIGEKAIFSPRFKQRMYFTERGEIFLQTGEGEGIEVRPQEDFNNWASKTWSTFTNAGEMVFGIVKRSLGAFVPLPVAKVPIGVGGVPSGAPPHNEWRVQIKNLVTGLGNAVRLAFGTAVVKEFPPEEEKSFFSMPLKGVIEITSLLGVPLTNIKMDEGGNFELMTLKQSRFVSLVKTEIITGLMSVMAKSIDMKSLDIKLGMAPSDNAALANIMSSIFNAHIHMAPQAPAGTLPTSPPVPPMPTPLVSSKTVKVGLV